MLDADKTKKHRWQHWEDLPSEEEEALIEKIAQLSVKRRIGLITEMVLESIGPISYLTANLGMATLGPYLEFFGVDRVAALFRKRGNLRRVLDRIEELRAEGDTRKKEGLKSKQS